MAKRATMPQRPKRQCRAGWRLPIDNFARFALSVFRFNLPCRPFSPFGPFRPSSINNKKRTSFKMSFSIKVAMTYSPTNLCSTIGAVGLNFSVRDGKRWIPDAINRLNKGLMPWYRTQVKVYSLRFRHGNFFSFIRWFYAVYANTEGMAQSIDSSLLHEVRS